MRLCLILIFISSLCFALPSSPGGFDNAPWGSAPEAVRQAAAATGATGWNADGATVSEFPKGMPVTAFRASATIAGYPATVRYYFWQGKFFQATIRFNFDALASYDLNYNVYKSVSDYYALIRSRTISFVNDCIDLLQKKYGTQKPWFKGLDPRKTFVNLDAYFEHESWNLRYHPLDFYRNIKTQAYSRWDFPKTSAIFSIAISAPDKRFDYSLSLSSADLAQKVNAARDSLRMRGL